MRATFVAVAISLAAGCDGRVTMKVEPTSKAAAGRVADPASSRLETGQGAMAYTAERDTEEQVGIYVPDLDPLRRPPLYTGDRLTIIEDRDDEADATRIVRVHVENGALAGRSGTMTRHDIRPARP